MTIHTPSGHGTPEFRRRSVQLVLRYFLGLVVIPQLALALGLLVVRHVEWVYAVITLPLVFYCAPVVGVFGNAHFITHATLCPADIAGWLLVVAFYTGAALVMATLHTLITRRRSIAEPNAPPNGGPATQLGNSGVTEGPPSVS